MKIEVHKSFTTYKLELDEEEVRLIRQALGVVVGMHKYALEDNGVPPEDRHNTKELLEQFREILEEVEE